MAEKHIIGRQVEQVPACAVHGPVTLPDGVRKPELDMPVIADGSFPDHSRIWDRSQIVARFLYCPGYPDFHRFLIGKGV